jgi:hypothetical protein
MVAMDRALRGLPIARDIVILTPEECERDKEIPGTIARPASKDTLPVLLEECLYPLEQLLAGAKVAPYAPYIGLKDRECGLHGALLKKT